MTLTFTTAFNFKVAESAIKDVDRKTAKTHLLSALIDKDDNVRYKGNLIPIQNTTCNGHKLLYFHKKYCSQDDNSTIKPINSVCTVMLLSNPYRGENPCYRPYKLGLEVLGIIKDNMFIIKEIKHGKYGVTSS